MNKIILLVSVLSISFLIVSCVATMSDIPLDAPINTTQSIISLTSTSQHVLAITPSPEFIQETPTIVIPETTTITLTQAPRSTIQSECFEILPALPPDFESSGIVVLDNMDTYLHSMKTGEEIQISESEENIIDVNASPDGRMIFYTRYIQEQYYVVIQANDGTTITQFPHDEHVPPTHWLDNQRIVFRIGLQYGDEVPEVERIYTIEVLNPFTGESQIVKPSFRDPYPSPYQGIWYNPSLTRVVYFQDEGSTANDWYPPRFVLWDVEKLQVLADFSVIGDYESSPSWSPDGKVFAIAPAFFDFDNPDYPIYEIYLVDIHGNVTQLTNLTTQFPYVYIADLYWSPDGKKIAFYYMTFDEYVSSAKNIEIKLGILDVSTGAVTDTCILADRWLVMGTRRVPDPVWSPDGSQILLKEPLKDSWLLIDLDRKLAAPFVSNYDVKAWLVEP